MHTLFINLICIHHNERITYTRFRHHTMETYKSYHLLEGKTLTKMFFTSSLVFSAKKFTIVLLEIPATLIKIQIYNDDFYIKKIFLS